MMKKVVILLFLIIANRYASLAQNLEVKSLRVENRENPSEVDVLRPKFQWMIQIVLHLLILFLFSQLAALYHLFN